MIALINRQMPRTLGDSFVHVSKLSKVVEVDDPLIEHPMSAEVSEVARKIGENIASLITDGATIQMGIGEIPDAVLDFLEDKKHLGVHTEMFSDGLVDLFEAGVVKREKTLHRGKTLPPLSSAPAAPSISSTTTPSWSSTPRTSTTRTSCRVTTRWSPSTRPSRSISPVRSVPTRSAPASTRVSGPTRLHPRRGAVGGGRADHCSAVNRQR